jgi:hypothetical protein
VDPKRFLGVRAVADDVEYLHSGKSVGKVCTSEKNGIFFFSFLIRMISCPKHVFILRWETSTGCCLH